LVPPIPAIAPESAMAVTCARPMLTPPNSAAGALSPTARNS